MKETCSEKTSSKRQELNMFSIQFNFEVISCLRCRLKFNFFHLENPIISKKTLHFCAFWLFSSFKSRLPKNIANFLNFKFRCIDEFIFVSKSFLSFVNTRKSPIFFSQSKVSKIWAVNSASWWNMKNFKHHLRKENIWNKTSLLKVEIVHRENLLSSPFVM